MRLTVTLRKSCKTVRRKRKSRVRSQLSGKRRKIKMRKVPRLKEPKALLKSRMVAPQRLRKVIRRSHTMWHLRRRISLRPKRRNITPRLIKKRKSTLSLRQRSKWPREIKAGRNLIKHKKKQLRKLRSSQRPRSQSSLKSPKVQQPPQLKTSKSPLRRRSKNRNSIWLWCIRSPRILRSRSRSSLTVTAR